jgi:hypothetical protein
VRENIWESAKKIGKSGTEVRANTELKWKTWRHQVIFEPAPLSGHFFVHFENTISSTESFEMDGQEFRIGNPGDQFRIHLVGDPDPAGKISGKFAGYAVGLNSHEN